MSEPLWVCPKNCGHSAWDHFCERPDCKRDGCHGHDGSDGPCDCDVKVTRGDLIEGYGTENARLRSLLREAGEALDSVDRRAGLLQSEHATLAKIRKEAL